MTTVAHISDLHYGRKEFKQPLKALATRLAANPPDIIVITGDITDSGLNKQYKAFLDDFSKIKSQILTVPGNHDRLNDNVAEKFDTKDDRVRFFHHAKTDIVAIDSTAPHNRHLILGHGRMCHEVINKAKEFLVCPDNFNIIALHHHPIPLPEETWPEMISKFFNYPMSKELHLGLDLIEMARGKVDLILFGHRHRITEMSLYDAGRPLHLYNAGCTPRWRKYRLFRYRQNEALDPEWIYF